ncbi:hypothetical protein IKF23_00910, partial [Candidatus Saccharibacteria bacterium]|nr:hypothetical protein [Candidatus Saccharibacteria bacterium]
MRIIHIKTNKHKFYSGWVLLVGFVYLTGPVLFNSSFAFADNLNTNVNIKPSLTLTIPESSIDLVLDPASKAFDSQDLHI